MNTQKLVRQARAAFSMLRAEDVVRRAERPVTVGLVADGSGAYAEMEAFLVPDTLPRSEARVRMGQICRANDPEVPPNVDLVLYEPGLGCPHSAYSFRRGDTAGMVEEILRDKGDLWLALARQFPAFRQAVIEGTIHTVAKENALFALATAVPNIVPSALELPWVIGEFASDTAFLTANQVRMAFQIAASCGRKVGLRDQKGELLAIVGGAFGWRALARELASHIPLGGGLIPKAAIAYAGTFMVGKGLAYFNHGMREPTPAERKELYREGLERGRNWAQEQNLRLGGSRA